MRSGGFLMDKVGTAYSAGLAMCWKVVPGGRCTMGPNHAPPCPIIANQAAYARLCKMIGWSEPLYGGQG